MTVSCPPNMILVLLRKISYYDIFGILGPFQGFAVTIRTLTYTHTSHTHPLSLTHTHANIQTDMQIPLLFCLWLTCNCRIIILILDHPIRPRFPPACCHARYAKAVRVVQRQLCRPAVTWRVPHEGQGWTTSSTPSSTSTAVPSSHAVFAVWQCE